MSQFVLESERVRLELQSPEDVLAQIEKLSPADRAHVSPEWLQRATATHVADPWVHGFSIVLRFNGVSVGNCGFKTPPSDDGVVEIAYGIDPDHRGLGYATEATRLLVEFAFNHGVRCVCAHTLLENGASQRVLDKCGFKEIGEVLDPEDGLVLRWERNGPSAPGQ